MRAAPLAGVESIGSIPCLLGGHENRSDAWPKRSDLDHHAKAQQSSTFSRAATTLSRMYQDLYIIHLESQHSLQYILQELGHRPLLEPKTRAERGQAIERSAQVLIQPARLKRNRIFMNSRDRTKGPKVVYASSHSLLVVEEDSSNEMRHDISFCVEGAYLIASSSLKREKGRPGLGRTGAYQAVRNT